MDRRRFVEMTTGALATGALAAGALAGGATRLAAQARTPAPVTRAEWDAARRWAATRFGRIAYVERGAGQGALFLHGFPLSSYQWRDAVARLAAHRRCVAPDFLGLGHTEVAAGQSVAPDAQVEMLVALLDRLEMPSVDVVASDSGGAVAQLLAVRHPARVRTLLLANCDAEIDSPPPALLPVIELARAGKFADEWLAPWLADRRLARSPEGIGGMCYADPAHPTDDAIASYFEPVLRSPERKAFLHAYAVALDPNPLAGIAPALARCTVPARVVWGTADAIFSKESPGYLARTFGNSRGVRSLEGRKLFWPEELPDVVAEEARLLWGVDQAR